MTWMLILAFAAMAFVLGCSVGGVLGWLDRHAGRLNADERRPSSASPRTKAA